MKLDLLQAQRDLQEGLRQTQQREAFAAALRTSAHHAQDRLYLKGLTRRARLTIKLARTPVARFTRTLIADALDRGVITATQHEELLEMADRRLQPGRH